MQFGQIHSQSVGGMADSYLVKPRHLKTNTNLNFNSTKLLCNFKNIFHQLRIRGGGGGRVMTIKDQISSAKAEKKLRNRQESKDSEPKTGKQMRPISKDQMHQMRIREGWPSNDDQRSNIIRTS